MIELTVDEAYAIDYLVILQVKYHKDPFNKEKENAFLLCQQKIKGQIDLKVWGDLMTSTEIRELWDANYLTYELVDKARKGELVTAKEIDDANMLRYNKKVALQKKFFNSEMTETKVVYDK